jgi:hypothetical protein
VVRGAPDFLRAIAAKVAEARIIHIGPPIRNGITSCRPTHCQREWSISAHPLLMEIIHIGPAVGTGNYPYRPTRWQWE